MSASSASNGYQEIAAAFIAARNPTVGARHVRYWAQALPRGGAVLDLGCGHGVPVSQILLAEGLDVYGIDASPALLAEYRTRLPAAHAACEAAEQSSFFGRTFDGIVAWGLIFLLPADTQLAVLGKAATALRPDGKLLFTAPWQPCAWTDVLTQRRSESLGDAAYRQALQNLGLSLDEQAEDEGGNHYYFASKAQSSARQ
jgi:SAM-dependent methyltransferase